MLRRSDQDDRRSLEAATEAAAKVNAILVAKGMLKPDQTQHYGTNIITKQVGGPNGTVVAEVEINNLAASCRNTLTKGATQDQISKASGAAVTTKGRYIAADEKARHPRDRCLYLNIQAATKESVDIAVQKINDIIKMMFGTKPDLPKNKHFKPHRGGRLRPPYRMNIANSRFNLSSHPPPPLMSLSTPPPPTLMCQPATQTVTIMQENLYIGLEHAPPNFDTKNKILGPQGSYLQHIQMETGSHVSLRGRGSGYPDPSGADSTQPMHVHLEHSSVLGLQEAKKLAENLIQTVQQSYVSFQQALAALPASIPTGLITGVPQQPAYVEAHMAPSQVGLATLSALTESQLHVLQPQGQQLLPPTMLMPAGSVASQLPPLAQAHLELTGQQPPLILSQPPPAGPTLTQVNLRQMVHGPPPTPQHIQTQLGAYSHVQPGLQLVSQTSVPPPGLMPPPEPGLLAQPLAAQLGPPTISLSAPSSLVYTMASSGPYYTCPKQEQEPKRKFTEEKDEKIPKNLLGYQHGPPHLVNLVSSSPTPQSMPPDLVPQFIQPSPQGLIHLGSPLPPEQGHHFAPPMLPPEQGHHFGPPMLPPEQGHHFAPAMLPPEQGHHFAPAMLPPGQQLLPPPALDNHQQIVSSPAGNPFQLSLPLAQFSGLSTLLMGAPAPAYSPRSPYRDCERPLSASSVLPPASADALGDRREEDPKFYLTSSEPTWGSGARKRGSPSFGGPDTKKGRGLSKSKHNSSYHQDKQAINFSEFRSEIKQEMDVKPFSAFPQYQGQPLRYPYSHSELYLHQASQESEILPHQLRLCPPLPPSLESGHLLPALDPQTAQAQVQMEEGSRAQVLLEHPSVTAGAQLHVTHLDHGLAGRAPTQQLIIEHTTPATFQMGHLPSQLADHNLQSHMPGPIPPPGTQDIYQFDAGGQPVPQATPQFHQTYEQQIALSQGKPPHEQRLPSESAVIVSDTQSFSTQYSVALSSAASPSPVSYTLQTSTPFPVHNPPDIQHYQRLPDGQHISIPPTSHSFSLPPGTATHFQAYFCGVQPPQTFSRHVIQQPPPPPASHTPFQAPPPASHTPFQAPPSASHTHFQAHPPASHTPFQAPPSASHTPFQAHPPASHTPFQAHPPASHTPFQAPPSASHTPFQAPPPAISYWVSQS